MGKDKLTRIFYIEFSKDGTSVEFLIHKSDPPDIDKDDFFQFSLKQVNNHLYVVSDMDSNRPHYSKVGIPDETIVYASKKILGCRICSSTNNPQKKHFENEFIIPAAEEVWKRLVQRDLAVYDSQDERYYTK